MNIEKQEVITITDNLGQEVRKGDTVVFATNAGLMIGVLEGFNKSGSIAFTSPIEAIDSKVSVRPSSIISMVKIEGVNL